MTHERVDSCSDLPHLRFDTQDGDEGPMKHRQVVGSQGTGSCTAHAYFVRQKATTCCVNCHMILELPLRGPLRSSKCLYICVNLNLHSRCCASLLSFTWPAVLAIQMPWQESHNLTSMVAWPDGIPFAASSALCGLLTAFMA